MRACGRGQHPGRMSGVVGGHNGEKTFIALFHVSEHSEHIFFCFFSGWKN